MTEKQLQQESQKVVDFMENSPLREGFQRVQIFYDRQDKVWTMHAYLPMADKVFKLTKKTCGEIVSFLKIIERQVV